MDLAFSNYQRLASYSQANQDHVLLTQGEVWEKIERERWVLLLYCVQWGDGVNNDVWIQNAHCNKPYVYTSSSSSLVVIY